MEPPFSNKTSKECKAFVGGSSSEVVRFFLIRLLFFFINSTITTVGNNWYYQLQMNTFCIQSVGIPETNIMSFSVM